MEWIITELRTPNLDDANKDGKVMAMSVYSPNTPVFQEWRFINAEHYPFWSKVPQIPTKPIF